MKLTYTHRERRVKSESDRNEQQQQKKNWQMERQMVEQDI